MASFVEAKLGDTITTRIAGSLGIFVLTEEAIRHINVTRDLTARGEIPSVGELIRTPPGATRTFSNIDPEIEEQIMRREGIIYKNRVPKSAQEILVYRNTIALRDLKKNGNR